MESTSVTNARRYSINLVPAPVGGSSRLYGGESLSLTQETIFNHTCSSFPLRSSANRIKFQLSTRFPNTLFLSSQKVT